MKRTSEEKLTQEEKDSQARRVAKFWDHKAHFPTPENVVKLPTQTPSLEIIEQHHAEAINESESALLEGIPQSGMVTRDVLADLISAAFMEGVLAEKENPFFRQL